MYSSVLSWLQPPYLYLVVNCIIISIVASSKLQLQKPSQQQVPLPSSADIIAPPVQVENISVRARSDYDNDAAVVSSDQYGSNYQDSDVDWKAAAVEDCTVKTIGVYEREEGGKAAPSMEFLFEKEKPLVSARLGRRKSLKANPEGNGKAAAPAALGVSKPKRYDTLESTWKTITDGRPMPLNRHLKKSDTWETHVRRDSTRLPKLTKKSETFNDRSSSSKPEKLARSPQGSGKLGREPSLGQDELNKRVEAFIKKFNEEMRLQRQESLNQYQEMIGRGAY